MTSLRTRQSLMLGAAIAALCSVGPAYAGSFQVNPVRLHLSERAPSTLLRVRNASSDPVRLQVRVFSWSESPAGEVELTPTKDILFYPSLLVIAAGETRNIRVGTELRVGHQQRTYRIFVEELPAVRVPDAPLTTIDVRTRMSIPIFFGSEDMASAPEIHLEESDKLRLSLENRGTRFFKATKLTVVAEDESGSELKSMRLPAWYVLPDGRRLYDIALPEDECIARLSVRLETEKSGAHEREFHISPQCE